MKSSGSSTTCVLAFSQEINDQDQALLEGLQLSRSMDVGAQTMMNPNWDGACARFQQAWKERMK